VTAVADGDDHPQWPDAVSAAWEANRARLFENQRTVSDWIVDHLDPRPGGTYLELTAGPGETGFLVAERIGPSGRLVSTDLAPGMVDAARRGAAARGLDNVECRTMDAQAIDLPDASVDGVLSRFGMMLLPEPARAADGARRVLRPGGKVAYGVWGPPDRNPWLMLLALSIAENGHELPGNPFGPGGVFSLGAPDDNRALLNGAGFDHVEVEEIPGVQRFASFDDYWTLQTTVAGSLALLVASLSAEELAAIRATLEPMTREYRTEPDGGLTIPSLAFGVVATAPR